MHCSSALIAYQVTFENGEEDLKAGLDAYPRIMRGNAKHLSETCHLGSSQEKFEDCKHSI